MLSWLVVNWVTPSCSRGISDALLSRLISIWRKNGQVGLHRERIFAKQGTPDCVLRDGQLKQVDVLIDETESSTNSKVPVC
jgi:hypothetical protein